MSEPMMMQPILESVLTEGETSLVFVDGEFSHAAQKLPSRGDYRVQSMYGGMEAGVIPERAYVDVAAPAGTGGPRQRTETQRNYSQ